MNAVNAVNAVNEPSALPDAVRSRFQLKPSRFHSASSHHFEGVDPASGKAVIVRAMHDSAFASAAERQRARRELQKLAQVRHDALAGVIDSGEAGELTWYARELVEGETLADRLTRGALDAGAAAWVAMKTASALAELHRHGVQHRDLRPERVVLARDGSVKILDAAVGRVMHLGDGRVVPGVPGYVAPEAITGRLVSFRSDLYALGATLYEALSGKPTFPVADPARRVQLQTEGDPAALETGAPEALTRLVFTLLAREQRDRPFSAQQVERQLEPLAKAPPPPDDELDLPDENERTVAFDTSAGLMPAATTTTPGLADADERSDDAPTRLNAGLDLPGSSTIVGMTAPVLSPAPSPPAAPASVGTATVNGRLPKMPTLPPIPSAANRSSLPGPVASGAPAAAAPPPNPRRATMLGMPMTDPATVAAVTPPAAPPQAPQAGRVAGKSGLDYDDLGDTTVNDDSRAFGLPGYIPSQGSAVPPLPGDGAQNVLAGRPAAGVPAVPPPGMHGPSSAPPAYDPMSSTVMAPAPVMGPGGVSSTVMMQMPGAPIPNAHAMPQNPYAPQGPTGSYPAQGQPMPAAPQGPSQVLPWIAGVLSVIAVASVIGLAVAKLRAHDAPQPETVTVVPQVTPTSSMPAMQPTAAPSVPEQMPTPAPVAMQPTPAPVAMQPTPAPTPAPVAVQPTPAPTPAPVAQPTPPRPVAPPQVAARTPPPPRPATPPAARPAPTPPVVAARPAPVAPAARPTPATPPAVAARPTPATPPAPAPAATGAVSANDPRITEALRTRNYPQARTLLQGALRAQPNNAGLHAQLGNVYERLGNRADALNEYRAATRIDRRNTQYMHRLVDLLVATNDRAGATATLRQILTITPNDRAAQARLQALGGT
jgi:serine/threonine protein kinase